MQVFSRFVSLLLPCPSHKDRDRDTDRADMMATPIGQESGALLVVVIVIVTAVITRVYALLCATTMER
jgi:hypothetical protein